MTINLALAGALAALPMRATSTDDVVQRAFVGTVLGVELVAAGADADVYFAVVRLARGATAARRRRHAGAP